jgi:hypothetical protein
MPSASFRFGLADEHEVKLVCGFFGKEKYFVDGNLAASYWSLRRNEVRSFKAFGRDIEIRINVNLKRIIADAYVDGELRTRDLFSEFNARIGEKRRGPSLRIKVAIWIVLALTFFAIFRAADAKPNLKINPDGFAGYQGR